MGALEQLTALFLVPCGALLDLMIPSDTQESLLGLVRDVRSGNWRTRGDREQRLRDLAPRTLTGWLGCASAVLVGASSACALAIGLLCLVILGLYVAMTVLVAGGVLLSWCLGVLAVVLLATSVVTGVFGVVTASGYLWAAVLGSAYAAAASLAAHTLLALSQAAQAPGGPSAAQCQPAQQAQLGINENCPLGCAVNSSQEPRVRTPLVTDSPSLRRRATAATKPATKPSAAHSPAPAAPETNNYLALSAASQWSPHRSVVTGHGSLAAAAWQPPAAPVQLVHDAPLSPPSRTGYAGYAAAAGVGPSHLAHVRATTQVLLGPMLDQGHSPVRSGSGLVAITRFGQVRLGGSATALGLGTVGCCA